MFGSSNTQILWTLKPQTLFAGNELKKWNEDVTARGRKDLVDYYTQEEIKVKFILNYLFAKSKYQRFTEGHDILATSVLEFISKISG